MGKEKISTGTRYAVQYVLCAVVYALCVCVHSVNNGKFIGMVLFVHSKRLCSTLLQSLHDNLLPWTPTQMYTPATVMECGADVTKVFKWMEDTVKTM